MTTKRHSRQVGIVHVLRSREWVSATSLAQRFEVAVRTIYRDIEELIAAGVPVESVSGPEGGYRLASDQPLAPLTLDADEALKLYVVSLLDRRQSDEPDSDIPELGNTYSREALKRLSQRIYFDTADWYWKDEGSGHLPAVRYALLTGTALKLTTRVKGRTEPAVTIVKPYGIVWKAGEWHLVAAPIDEEPTRYRLNLRYPRRSVRPARRAGRAAAAHAQVQLRGRADPGWRPGDPAVRRSLGVADPARHELRRRCPD